MKEMIIKGKPQLAEEYLKKCLVTFSSNFDLLGSLLIGYAKLVKKCYQGGAAVQKAVTFTLD